MVSTPMETMSAVDTPASLTAERTASPSPFHQSSGFCRG